MRIPPLDGRERARVEELVRDVTDEEGFEILAYLLRPDRTLRLTLDRESRPVDISALTFLNHRIRGALEEAGLAVDDYAVELESPGVRRILATLRHFERFLGEFARVRWNEDKDEALGTQRVRIESVQGDAVHARRENGEPVQFTVAELHSARLDPDAEPKRSRE